ncbi:MAG TPA: hypothetical protein VMU39_15325 [Solirubrobacteraceae bacterium]|nr:hypothetical protein [Solirubrobacteraceae bacterium]
MTAFFIPGISRDSDGRALDLADRDMRRCVELEMGRRPSARRIEMLCARRGNIDYMTVVAGRIGWVAPSW